MNTHRTVGWLAILMIITPFLAIPEWLLQTVITILGLAVVGTIWFAGSKETQQSQPELPNIDEPKKQSDPDYPQKRQADQKQDKSDPQEPLDIEDPKADTMMATDRWRKRSSRDIS